MAGGIILDDCPFCDYLVWEDEDSIMLEGCVFAHEKCCNHEVLSRTESNGIVTLVIKLSPLKEGEQECSGLD